MFATAWHVDKEKVREALKHSLTEIWSCVYTTLGRVYWELVNDQLLYIWFDINSDLSSFTRSFSHFLFVWFFLPLFSSWLLCCLPALLCGLLMPPSSLDDRFVVPLQLYLDTTYLETTVGAIVVEIQVTDLIYMPSSSSSTRSLTCGCNSASCCTVSTYEKDSQTQTLTQTSSQVSTSSPNLNSGVSHGGHGGISRTLVGQNEAYSAPSLSSSTPRGGVRLMHPSELAQKMTYCPAGHPVGPLPIIIDCRPFMDYNKGHIRGAVHVNCSDRISRRRLQQGKITVLDLISSRQSKDFSFRGISPKEIVVYDERTLDAARLALSQPLHVVLESLRRDGSDPIVLQGKFCSFGRKWYPGWYPGVGLRCQQKLFGSSGNLNLTHSSEL